MHGLLLTAALLLPGVWAHACCPIVGDGDFCGCGPCAAADGGNFGSQAPPPPVEHLTHTWTRVSPSQVLASLHEIAQQTPDAVSLLGNAVPTGGHLSGYIQPPPGCTSLPQDTSTGGYPSETGAASSTYAAASSTYAAASSTEAAASSTTEGGDNTYSGASSTTLAKSTKASYTSSSASASSTKPSKTGDKCTEPTARVEWRNMSPSDQTGLIKAVKCLMTTQSRSGLTAAKTRWDDLVAVHQQMAGKVHQVGQFLVWHRQFMWVYEQELRNTCKYTGPIPWWDETQDSGAYGKAPMMTSELYGTAPEGNNTCLKDGAFKGAALHIGPGDQDITHCLSRGFNEDDSAAVTNDFVNSCNSYEGYGDMNMCQYYGPHAFTHDALGGSMSDVASSPNDPLFFLHHAFVDRNYRNWQLADPQRRTYAIGGYTTPECTKAGGGCKQTTLNDVLSTMGFYPDVTIAQVADTQGGHLCYYYDA